MADLDPRDFAYGYIHNWERHQHYRYRRPTWIKDYVDQLRDPDYLALSAASRGVLGDLRLLYADMQVTPNLRRGFTLNTAYLSSILSVRVSNIQLAALNHAGLIDFSASKTLAQLNTTGAQSKRTELEREKEPLPTLSIEPALVVVLEPIAEAAFLILAAIDKPGYHEPKFTRARFAPLVAAHPVSNLVGEAEALADFETHGKGAGKPLEPKEGISRFRNWLKKAPRVAAVPDGPKFVDPYDRRFQPPPNPDFVDPFILPSQREGQG